MAGEQPSQKAKQALINEAREAIGDEAVDRADLDVDRALRDGASASTPEVNRSRLLFVVSGAAGVVVAGIVALVLESWLVLGVLLVLHAIGTFVVMSAAFRTASRGEKPAPTTAAMLEDEGVKDPDGALTRLVEQAATNGDKTGRADDHAADGTSQQ